MKKAFLFGHSGSINRGCEAIVRSTTRVLKGSGFDDVNLFIDDQSYDKKLKVDEVVNFVPVKKRNKLFRGICYVLGSRCKIIFPSVIRQKAQAKKVDKNDLVFTIGGDTYCYGFPYNFAGFNKVAKQRGLTNVLWGCSVDERIFNHKVSMRDMNNYSYIVARETLTLEILKKVVKDHSKLYLACDPAFNLETEETDLPENFKVGNTVGLNVSHLFFGDYKDKNDIMRRNVSALIDYILNETDMSICLVPHVYDIERNLQDIDVLKTIKSEYPDNDRICIVNENLNCQQLKYIISNCKLFVGARTHSVIAAYSTGVPALALSYSIKSRGIAKDLYGDESLVVQYKKIKEDNEVCEAFKSLVEREEKIRAIYAERLEDYKATIYQVAKELAQK